MAYRLQFFHNDGRISYATFHNPLTAIRAQKLTEKMTCFYSRVDILYKEES